MSGDLTRSATGILIWGVPIAVLAVSAHMDGIYAAVAWPLALVFMGVACLLNARRCGRTHCYFTGPFFLILAVVSLLYGLGILDLSVRGWSWLSLTLLLGTVALVCVPELLLGRYRERGKLGSGT